MSRFSEYPFLIGSSNRCDKRLHNVKEVAAFICREGLIDDVTVQTPDGEPVLDTFGIFINKISDMEYREELLEVLVPMQKEIQRMSLSPDDSSIETYMDEHREYDKEIDFMLAQDIDQNCDVDYDIEQEDEEDAEL